MVSAYHDVLSDDQDLRFFDLADRYAVSGWASHQQPFEDRAQRFHTKAGVKEWVMHLQLQRMEAAQN